MNNPRKARQSSKPVTLKDVLPRLASGGGYDPDTVQKLFEALSAHFSPQDILEEIWLHDIAEITSNIQVFRVIDRSLQLQSMTERLDKLMISGAFDEAEAAEAEKGILDLTFGTHSASGEFDLTTLKVVGGISPANIGKIASTADVIQKLQRERDRIYAQFERKRRPLVIASVKMVEGTDAASNPMNKLGE